MAKYVRERAGVSRGFGQNPIEWLHFMSKSEIDDVAHDVRHKDVTLSVALQSLKGRVLRLYKNAAKAVYDEGHYKLDNAYSNFSIDYDTWMDLPQEDREVYLKRFFAANHSILQQHERGNHVLNSPADAAASSATSTTATSVYATVLSGISDPVSVAPSTAALAPVIPAFVLPASVASATTSSAIAVPATVPASTIPSAVPSATTLHLPAEPNLPKRLSVSFADLGIPEDCISRSTLECLYRNAEALLNEPSAIMQAASSDPRMMTVKSRHGKAPLIVKPLKNANQFECNCTTYKSLGVCQDVIAVTSYLGCLQKYIEGLRAGT